MDRQQIGDWFKLDDEIRDLALLPRSLGGGSEFKVLALFGDLVIDLVLLEFLLGKYPNFRKLNQGKLTELRSATTNRRTFRKLATHLGLDQILKGASDNDIKEAIEALVGACFQTKGFEVSKHVAMRLILIIAQENYFDDNPKKSLLELVQGKISEGAAETNLPNFDDTNRVGGTDHQPLFICNLNFQYLGQQVSCESKESSDKKSAQRNAARRALNIIKQINIQISDKRGSS